MNVEVLSGLVNFGMAGAVIAVVMIFLKFNEKQSTADRESREERDRAMRESMETRDRSMREFITQLTAATNSKNDLIKQALDDLIKVTSGLVEKVGTLESELYLHDARVDKLVEKMERPETSAPSMLPKRRKVD